MKFFTSFLLYFFIVKVSSCQTDSTTLIFGKYEGIQVKFYRHPSDTSDRVERANKVWGTKTLIIESSGGFSLEFPVPYPTTRIYPRRFTKGSWAILGDTLILHTYYSYKDFVKVREKKTDESQVRVRVTYAGRKKYYPDMDVIINGEEKQTGNRPWVYFRPDTVQIIKIGRYAGPTSWEQEWLYIPKKSNSNSFKISVKTAIDGNDFVLENYRLLIRDSSLVQINEAFGIDVKQFKWVGNP